MIVGLIGCATTYQSVSHTGGFSETQLGENMWRISFQGNGYTSEDRTADFALLRSAELTLIQGYRYFIIIDGSQSTQTNIATIGGNTSRTYGSANTIGNTTTFNATTINTTPNIYMIRKPSATNTILMYKEDEKPEGIVYDAEFLDSSLRSKYEL